MTSRYPTLRLTLILVALLAAGCVSGPGQADSQPTLEPSADLHTVDAGNVSAGDARYVSENDTVRYPAVRNGDEILRYESLPFAEYAELQCIEPALEKAEELDIEAGGGSGDTYGWDGEQVIVTVYSDSGADPDSLREQFPDGLEVSLTLFGRDHTCRMPIAVKESSRPVHA